VGRVDQDVGERLGPLRPCGSTGGSGRPRLGTGCDLRHGGGEAGAGGEGEHGVVVWTNERISFIYRSPYRRSRDAATCGPHSARCPIMFCCPSVSSAVPPALSATRQSLLRRCLCRTTVPSPSTPCCFYRW
jgi:hypothetical protein